MSTIKLRYNLDSFQKEACDNIDNGYNIVVSAPTGSGKTAIAEYSIEYSKLKDSTSKIIYTCPIKSLCNEKYRDMNIFYNSINSNYVIGLMTGDIIINPDGDIIIMTTEVLYNLMVTTNNNFNPKCIIFDEVHYINDDGRGHIWEKCIITSVLNYDCILVLLSATIGNMSELLEWLNSINSTKKFIPIIKTERPVPLREFVIVNTKSRIFTKKTADVDEEIRSVSSDPNPEMYDLLELNENNYRQVNKYWTKLEEFGYSLQFELETLCNQINSNPNLGIPAIIFVLSKKKCIQYAHMIQTSYVTYKESNEILRFFDSNLKEFVDCSQYIELRKTIINGVGYHHSGLIPKIREVVEFLIKNKLIKIVFATETFAVGLNFPVKTVVLTGLNKPTSNGIRNLYVSEYKQMAGRAGRRFIDIYGNVIIWLYKERTVTKNPYPSWQEIYNITRGPVDNIVSKYIIEPNYILKNIITNSYNQTSYNSFKYYKSEKNKSPGIDIPDKFVKIFDIEKKMIEYSKNNITFKDKNYLKLFNKFTKEEQNDYKKFLQNYSNSFVKNEIELYNELEQSIIQFLLSNDFIKENKENKENIENIENKEINPKIILTNKGLLAQLFNEINPILFVNHMDLIFTIKNNIIPILSMFIDDGASIDETIINWSEPEIIFWEKLIKNNYENFIDKYPKWTFYPLNFRIVKQWISNPMLTLDDIVNEHQIDMGTIAKILIKMYQISDELINNLNKINQSDLTEFINEQKKLLIRYPLKIDSLYIKN